MALAHRKTFHVMAAITVVFAMRCFSFELVLIAYLCWSTSEAEDEQIKVFRYRHKMIGFTTILVYHYLLMCCFCAVARGLFLSCRN